MYLSNSEDVSKRFGVEFKHKWRILGRDDTFERGIGHYTLNANGTFLLSSQRTVDASDLDAIDDILDTYTSVEIGNHSHPENIESESSGFASADIEKD